MNNSHKYKPKKVKMIFWNASEARRMVSGSDQFIARWCREKEKGHQRFWDAATFLLRREKSAPFQRQPRSIGKACCDTELVSKRRLQSRQTSETRTLLVADTEYSKVISGCSETYRFKLDAPVR
jgi:hypothetical protein